MHLFGSKQCKLDAKGRLTLPAAWRKQLGDSATLCMVPLNGALRAFTPEGHEAFLDSLFPGGANPRDPKQAKLSLGFNAMTTQVDIDSAGRVCLGKVPEAQRSQLGLGQDVTLVGNADHFEVWDTPTWEAEQANIDLDALMFDSSR